MMSDLGCPVFSNYCLRHGELMVR